MSKELILKLRYIALCADRADVRETVGQAADALEAKAAPVGEREAFEAWAASVGYHAERDRFQREKYQSTLTWELWQVWQAGAAYQRAQQTQSEYGDAYQGAREDLAIWKRRALEAEARVRQQDQIIDQMGEDLNAINGPTFMGEPVIQQPQSAEAVEWRCRVAGSDHWAHFPTKRCRFCEPLYTTPQPSAGVVMPERKDESKYRGTGLIAARRWNACLDEFARLNGREAV